MEILQFVSTYWSVLSAIIGLTLFIGGLGWGLKTVHGHSRETRKKLYEHIEDDRRSHDALEIRLQAKDDSMHAMNLEVAKLGTNMENLTKSVDGMSGKLDRFLESKQHN